MNLSTQVARRFILGRQGLWPGRRWRGKAGTKKALNAIELLQMDPLNVVARSHDLELHARVLDYKPEYFDDLLYTQREFFDSGGGLDAKPMRELPYWRVVMRRKAAEGRWAAFAKQNAELIERMRAEVRERGPVGNRDFAGEGPAITGNYRGRKNTAIALYYLWLTGELMTHHRHNFERRYDLRERVALAEYDREAGEAETDRFLMRKLAAYLGLVSARGWARSAPGLLERPVSREESRGWLDEAVEAGELLPVSVDGHPEPYYALARDKPALNALAAGRVPRGWRPLDTTTETEAVFLAPLDIVSARGRAKVWFDFEYLWEVYKPAHKRRWGYYVLPILWGDTLVGRLDPRLDRASGTLFIQGFWLEDADTGRDADFAAALSAGLVRLARFVRARRVDVAPVRPVKLRQFLKTELKNLPDKS